MFNPTKTWRRWHRKVNVTQKRHALAAAVSATAVPALVMARGHQIMEVNEIPCIVSDEVESVEKTKAAVELLKKLGAEDELAKAADSKKIRAGKGKMRNRRYVMRKGPLVVYAEDKGCAKAFRNIPGVECCKVEQLNLLQLAPGGTFGRFVVWTESAIKRLAGMFGTYKGGSDEKKGYTLPRSIMTNTDIARIINSNEVQSVLRPAKETPKTSSRQRKNPLKNKSVLGRLMPVALAQKKVAKLAHVKGSKIQTAVAAKVAKKKAVVKAHKKVSKQFFKDLQGAYAVKKETAAEEAEE
jgi:large subunit ribosomal protein L4e